MGLKQVEIYSDGACSGNPGRAGIGVVIKCGQKVIWEYSQPIGTTTNNVAEYTAAIYGLQQALILRAETVVLYTDSELFARQICGVYRVKHPNIKFLFALIQHLKTGFRQFRVEHLPREGNKDADRLAKQSIKTERPKAVALELFSGEESPSSKG